MSTTRQTDKREGPNARQAIIASAPTSTNNTQVHAPQPLPGAGIYVMISVTWCITYMSSLALHSQHDNTRREHHFFLLNLINSWEVLRLNPQRDSEQAVPCIYFEVVIKKSRVSVVFWFPFCTGRHIVVYPGMYKV